MKTSWKKMKKSPYLSSADIPSDIGYLILTIKQAEQRLSKGLKDDANFNFITFEEDYKDMLLNSTNSKAIEFLAGSEFIEDWKGLRIKITTEKVKAFGEVTSALRIQRIKNPVDVAPNKVQANETQILAMVNAIKDGKRDSVIKALGKYEGITIEQLDNLANN